jgi:hypothetical protein
LEGGGKEETGMTFNSKNMSLGDSKSSRKEKGV